MPNEIERKFLVDPAPGGELLGPGLGLRQGYLAEDGEVEVRIRITDVAAVVGIKAGRGLSRKEVEVPVAVDEAAALWPYTEGRRVEKRRHRVVVEGGIAEVDVYEGPLAGLCTVEVEFADEAAAAAFAPPAWFGRELTGRAGWSNAALARHGLPPAPPSAG